MKKVTIVLMILVLAGCASPGKRSWFAKWMIPVNTAYLEVGMTEAQVRDLCRFPNDVNRTVVDGTVREQWVYEQGYERIYLYLENGILVAWQD